MSIKLCCHSTTIKMHLRPFSYPVTKPYPFRWFTPLVIIGGLVLVVLFSLWTYPPNAYEMQSQTSLHPRETEKYKPPPPRLSWWYGDDLKAKCQPYELLVGSRFFTVNRGFLYTVDRVYRYDPQANINITVEESVSYLGDTLENCRPIKIIIGLGKDDSAEPPTFWISWIGESYFDLRATYVDCLLGIPISGRFSNMQFSCAINTANGQHMWIEISTKKSGVAKDEFDYIIDHHRTQSFWWGAQLLNTYWFSLMQVLAQKGHFKDKNNGFYNRGRFTFNYNYDPNNIKYVFVFLSVPVTPICTFIQNVVHGSMVQSMGNSCTDPSLGASVTSIFMTLGFIWFRLRDPMLWTTDIGGRISTTPPSQRYTTTPRYEPFTWDTPWPQEVGSKDFG